MDDLIPPWITLPPSQTPIKLSKYATISIVSQIYKDIETN